MMDILGYMSRIKYSLKKIRKQLNVYNMGEAAKELGVDYNAMYTLMTVVPPDFELGQNVNWTKAGLEKLRAFVADSPILPKRQRAEPGMLRSGYFAQKDIRKEKGWFNTSEAIRELKVGNHVFDRLARAVPPDVKLGMTGVWSSEAIAEMKELYTQQLSTPPVTSTPNRATSDRDRLEKEGFIAIYRACEIHDVSIASWTSAVRHGNVEGPSHQRNKPYKFYTLDEAAKIAELLKKCRPPEGYMYLEDGRKKIGISISRFLRLVKKLNLGVIVQGPAKPRRFINESDLAVVRQYLADLEKLQQYEKTSVPSCDETEATKAAK